MVPGREKIEAPCPVKFPGIRRGFFGSLSAALAGEATGEWKLTQN